MILTQLTNKLSEERLDNIPLSEALAEIFTTFQEVNYARGIAEARAKPSKRVEDLVEDIPLVSLLISDPIHIAEVLRTKLEGVSHKDRKLVMSYLKTTVSILNVMITKGVDKTNREKLHEPLYNAIKQCAGDPDLEIAFLANYGVQELALVPSETNMHSFFRRSWYVVQGLAEIADSISLMEPWHILKAVSSVKYFKKAFTFQQGKKEWFLHLRVLEQQLRNHPKDLVSIADHIYKDPKDAKETLDLNNPFFVQGFVNILWELISNPMTEPSVTLKALDLLKTMWEDNHKKQDSKSLFTIDAAKYQPALCHHLLQLIYNCKEHFSEDVKNEANEIINKFKAQSVVLPRFAVPFYSNNFPSELFDKALEAAASPHFCLKYVATTLEKDYQVQKDRDLFISPYVQEDDMSPPEFFDRRLKAFEEGEDRALVIEGEPGFGKSLLAKLSVLGRAKRYSNEAFSFYFPLQKFQNPFSNLLLDGFAYNGIKEEKQVRALETCKLICWCDGIDEVRYPNGLEKLLITNEEQLKRYPYARFIFFQRKKFANLEYFYPPPGYGYTQKVQLSAFRKELFYYYAWNFLQAKEKQGRKKDAHPTERIPASWDYNKFSRALDILCEFVTPGTDLKVISNPLFLAITLDVLPFIMNKLRGEYSEANKEKKEPTFEELLDSMRDRLQTELLMAYTCVNAFREVYRIEKTRIGEIKINEVELVEFQYQLALLMKECDDLRVIKFPLEGKAKERLASFLEVDAERDRPSERVQLLLEAGLMGSNEEGWMFRHDEFRMFFLAIDRFVYGSKPGENRLDEIKSYLRKDRDVYHYRDLVRR